MKAVRHYYEARSAISAQLTEDKRRHEDPDGAVALPILDFSPAFDDLASDMYAVVRAIRRMERLGIADAGLVSYGRVYKRPLEQIYRFRCLIDHMDEEIEKYGTEGGLIRCAVSADGLHVLLRTEKMAFADVKEVIEGLFDALASTYPSFSAAPRPQLPGRMSMTVRATLTTIEKE